MVKQFSLPRGTSDILPSEIPLWQSIEARTRKIFAIYHYQEIRTPLFEETELFARSMGQTSDVVQKQMLSLQSQKQADSDEVKSTSFSLRPEGTASIVRSYIENSLDRKEGLSKLFYIGPMFRGERPQKGRLRQFHQIGVEAIGPNSASPYLDAEVISLCVHLLSDFGIKDFQVKINTLGTPEDKANFSKQLRESLRPKILDLCEDCQNRFDRNVFRILDCKTKNCRSVVEKLDIGDAHLSHESRQYFKQVKEALDGLGISYIYSPLLVRGLDYYTHTVFEVSSASLGSQDALGAGGRYNNLVSDLGGPQVDAIGFALGMERIILALPQEEKFSCESVDAVVIALDEHAMKKGFEVLDFLRKKGVAAEMNYRLSSMKSQMRFADKIGSKNVLILGEDEIKKGTITFKNMEQGTQQEIQQSDLDHFVNTLAHRKV